MADHLLPAFQRKITKSINTGFAEPSPMSQVSHFRTPMKTSDAPWRLETGLLRFEDTEGTRLPVLHSTNDPIYGFPLTPHLPGLGDVRFLLCLHLCLQWRSGDLLPRRTCQAVHVKEKASSQFGRYVCSHHLLRGKATMSTTHDIATL